MSAGFVFGIAASGLFLDDSVEVPLVGKGEREEESIWQTMETIAGLGDNGFSNGV